MNIKDLITELRLIRGITQEALEEMVLDGSSCHSFKQVCIMEEKIGDLLEMAEEELSKELDRSLTAMEESS